jgi:hypothetical protein
VNVTGRLHDVFEEDLRSELTEIQSPEARRLFVEAGQNTSVLYAGEYATLAATAHKICPLRWRAA